MLHGPACVITPPVVDHLRTLVVVPVVNMHACVTYSHVGGWYYMSDREPSLAEKPPFILWQAQLQFSRQPHTGDNGLLHA